MTSGTLVICHPLIRIMVPIYHIRMGSAGVWAPVWTVSGMRHWKRLIKIPSDTDCYYYINNMPCPIHVSYCLVALVTIPDILSTIMSHVYFVTLPDTCYTSGSDTLLMYIYTLHSIHFLFHIFFVHTLFLYAHDTITRLFLFVGPEALHSSFDDH